MAKGQVSKALINKKIIDTFEGAFAYNDGKEIRIPMQEDGVEVQIKVTLTCAKDNVQPGDDNALPGSTVAPVETLSFKSEPAVEQSVAHVAPTAEEKANVKGMLEFLGL